MGRGHVFSRWPFGVAVSLGLFSRKTKKPYFVLADFLAPLTPIGLAAGRIGNFINGELWGRITDVPWAMIYPPLGPEPRHPSMLYNFFLRESCYLRFFGYFPQNHVQPCQYQDYF